MERAEFKWSKPRNMIEVGRVMRHRATKKVAVAVVVSGREARLVGASGDATRVSIFMNGQSAQVAGYAATETRFTGGVVPFGGRWIAISGDEDGPWRESEAEAQTDLDAMMIKRLREWTATQKH